MDRELRDDISSALEQEREQVSDNNQIDQVEENSRPSVRDSIKAAFDEHRDDDVSEDNPSERTLEKSEQTDNAKLPAWAKKIKNIPPELASDIIAREKEINTGFEQAREKFKPYEELEKVFAPRYEQIRQLGVSPAQFVDRLLAWSDKISHADPNAKLEAFRELAEQMGIDLKDPNLHTPLRPGESIDNLPRPTPPLDPVIQNRTNKQVSDLRANPKFPYYNTNPQLRGVMVKLLGSGAIPMTKNTEYFGGFDVERAYQMACNLLGLDSTKQTKEAKPKSSNVRSIAKAPADKSVRGAILNAMKG